MSARDIALEALKFYANAAVYKPDSVGRILDITDVASAAIATLEAEPVGAVAWMKGYLSSGAPDGDPPEWDVACVEGQNPPENDGSWLPLYTSPPPAVPPGWKLVPIEPTLEIIEAICAAVATCMWPNDYHIDAQAGRRRNARLAYLEMLAAAPGAPA
mgnify:CR=1 FL=1